MNYNRFSLFYMLGCFSMTQKQYVPCSVTTDWHWRLFHSRLPGSVAKMSWHLAQIPFITSLHAADRWMIKRKNERTDKGIFPAPVCSWHANHDGILSQLWLLIESLHGNRPVIFYPVVHTANVHSTLPVEFSFYILHVRVISYPWIQVLVMSQTFAVEGQKDQLALCVSQWEGRFLS